MDETTVPEGMAALVEQGWPVAWDEDAEQCVMGDDIGLDDGPARLSREADGLPYVETVPVRDSRTSRQCLDAAEGGLDGTGVYRAGSKEWEAICLPATPIAAARRCR